jgi:hypothetical protein
MAVIPKLCALARRGAAGYFKILFFSFNLCVFFQTAIKLLGQIVIK